MGTMKENKIKKIGIATVYTGYNYGSSLQAFATKQILGSMGYEAELLKLGGSLVPGRDIRIKKLFTVLFRSLIHAGGIKSLKNYGTGMAKTMQKKSMTRFHRFTEEMLLPKELSYRALKKEARQDTYAAFLCGSDQIWNSAVFYVDPFYYLQFAPKEKRIAFAPSFGRDYIAEYNRKKIAKYISEIPHLSIRESSGGALIQDMTGRQAEVLLDPTLVLDAEEWIQALHLQKQKREPYLLAYFLDMPSEKAIRVVNEIAEKQGLRIVFLPYVFEKNPPETDASGVGPIEFVEYIKNASFVCTDSFHGTAFSLNFNIPFYTFERNYGHASTQSARIESILQLTEKQDRYEPSDTENCMELSFSRVNDILQSEREKVYEYLRSVLSSEKIGKDAFIS